MFKTQVVEYKNRRALNKGIRKMSEQGWSVVNTQVVDQGYGGVKTCLLGCLFLPLALLGRKPVKYLVTFQRAE